jgi:hypothetical protein
LNFTGYSYVAVVLNFAAKDCYRPQGNLDEGLLSGSQFLALNFGSADKRYIQNLESNRYYRP